MIVVLVAVPEKTFCWPPLIVVLMAVSPGSTADRGCRSSC
jgi:hypothetical protein